MLAPHFARRLAVALLTGTLLNPAFASPDTLGPKGSLVIIGGALRPTTQEVWSRIVTLAGGRGARIAVFPSAAREPLSAGERTVKILNRHGARAFLVPLATELETPDYRSVASDAQWVARVARAGGIFFTGGEQARITRALRTESGAPTPMLAAIREVFARGGTIAGTSAGAAIMSATMFNEPRDTLTLLREGLSEGRDIAPGLGFVPAGLFVDQHFIVRGRFARLIAAMLKTSDTLGLGIDEDSAAVLRGRSIEIIGSTGAVLIDSSEAKHSADTPALKVANLRISYLDRGDRYDMTTRHALSGKAARGKRVDPGATDFHPSFAGNAAYPNVLGRNVLPELLAQLADSAQSEMIGLAFDLASADAPQTAFEFRFRKGPESVAFYAGEFSADPYSVFELRLDITPVLINAPLYRPLPAPLPPQGSNE